MSDEIRSLISYKRFKSYTSDESVLIEYFKDELSKKEDKDYDENINIFILKMRRIIENVYSDINETISFRFDTNPYKKKKKKFIYIFMGIMMLICGFFRIL